MSASGYEAARGDAATHDAALEAETLRVRTLRPSRNTISSWSVTLVSAAMAILASLALAASIGAARLADRWTGDLEHRATLTLPPSADDVLVARLRGDLAADPGVAAVEIIERATAQRELAALLGEDAAMVKDLPLAPMIDITFHAAARDAAPELLERLKRAGLTAHIDAHDDFAGRLAQPAAQLRSFAVMALAVIGVAAALMVGLACASALAAHAEMVDVLRLVGARDSFVAQLFERPLQVNAFIGSGIGTAAAFAVVVAHEAPEAASSALELAPLLLDLRPNIVDWPSFVAIPLVFALIATVASRVAVAFALRRREE